MATVARLLGEFYTHVVVEKSDPRNEHLPFMSSPWDCILLIIVYHLFIHLIGPSVMESRKAFDLKYTMILYNIVQIGLNFVFVYQASRIVWIPRKYGLLCAEVDYSDDPEAVLLAFYTWLFFMTKVLDLLDTVFMVLRKKQNQVSFLHVYHHTGMVGATWAAAKYFGGGHPIFFGTVNSFVHMVMYSYYLLTALYPEYKKNIWWKKHITELQLVQFIVTGIHALVALLNPMCSFPKVLLAIFIPQVTFMFVMFWDFYKKAYMKGKPEKVQNGTPIPPGAEATISNTKED